jgi:hypothetical protein
MPSARLAAWVFAGLTAVVVLFQLALAAGAPWGAYAMGGAFPGTFPATMRIAAVVQAAILTGVAMAVLGRAGMGPRGWWCGRQLAWAVVGLLGVGVVLNLFTPSGMERLIWAPVVIVMLLCALRVAISATPPAR